MVLMNLVVCSMSSLELQSFSASVDPWGQCCARDVLYRGRTAELGFVGLSYMGMQSIVCEGPR